MTIFNYTLTHYDKHRINTSLIFGLVTMICTMPYYWLTDNINTEWYWALLMGFKFGVGAGILEEFIFANWFRKLPFILMVLLRAFIYMLIVAWAFVGLEIFSAFLNGEPITEAFNDFIHLNFLINFLYILTVFDFLIFFNQINKFLGHGRMFSLWSGKYHYPQKEFRFFMFLDIISSTEISANLGKVEYYKLINDFFHDITNPVLQSSATIYQYVGDEVVLTWNLSDGLADNNCIEIFFRIKEVIRKRSKYYLDNYGVIPLFKAGAHYGEVITAEVGDLKKEIIHNGEVINTASRIRSACSDYHKELMISQAVHNKLFIHKSYKIENIGGVMLKGLTEPLNLYSVEKESLSNLKIKKIKPAI